MTVRRVVEADVDGVDWLDDGTRTGLAAAATAGPSRALVIGEAGAGGLVAVLAVDLPPWRNRTVPWLWLVAVRPERRGQGVGGALLAEAHRRLAMTGHRAVELSVDDGNPRAAALYRRLGYEVVGTGNDLGPDGPQSWTRMRLSLRP
jgi:ribosomal protein S18 acetylase RimI-like enzyme